MKNESSIILPAFGVALAGGFYTGMLRDGDDTYAIVSAPKTAGEIILPWSESSKRVDGATSFVDGMANTLAMAAAGSKLAAWALALDINGQQDWHIPSQDEVELQYRNHKPGQVENYLYGRSGINVSAVPPTRPYTPTNPAQTQQEAFQAGGAEEFELDWYWTSTQHAATSHNAWMQDFSDGGQDYDDKSSARLVRVVRRFKI